MVVVVIVAGNSNGKNKLQLDPSHPLVPNWIHSICSQKREKKQKTLEQNVVSLEEYFMGPFKNENIYIEDNSKTSHVIKLA